MLQTLTHGAGLFATLLLPLRRSSAQKRSCGDRETAQQLRSHAALTKDRGFGSQHLCWLISSCNSSSRSSHQSSDPCRLLHAHSLYACMQVQSPLCTPCPAIWQTPQQRELRGFLVSPSLRFDIGSAFHPPLLLPWRSFSKCS